MTQLCGGNNYPSQNHIFEDITSLIIMKYLSLFICFLFLGCANSDAPEKTSELGKANLEVTGLPEAKADFEKGLLLLYSFEYEDARDEFESALQRDSSMAMAYWGVAMTYNHPLWRAQLTDSAQYILALRKQRNANTDSELESDFLESLDILYEDGESKEIRDQNYANFFEKLNEKYPNNQEVAAFYSLALLGSVSDGRDVETYEKAGEVASEILETNPNHPGALHYVIHAYDDPQHAEMAMDAANAYAKVAPDASHALHMPSHIFIAKGMWDKVIASNVDAYQASVDRMETKGLKDGARSYHAYAWLQYAYLQNGNAAEAEKMLTAMEEYLKNDPTKGVRSYMIDMKGHFLIDSGDWNSRFAGITVDVTDLNILSNAQTSFQDAMVAFTKNNTGTIDSLIASLDDNIRRQELYLDTVDFKLCLPTQRSAPKPTDIAVTKAILLQIKALREWNIGNTAATEKYIVQSAATADTLDFSYGPPEIQKPVHEFYADWLMTQEQYNKAAIEYEKALEDAPGRRLSEQGLAKAKKSIDTSTLAVID